MLMALYAIANGTTDTLSNPAGMTQDLDVSTQFGASGLSIGAFHELLSASTATTTLVTNSGGAISAVSIGHDRRAVARRRHTESALASGR
jgi:hypothetical protein